MDARITKLQEIEKRYNEISDEMMKEEVVSDPRRFTKLSKEQASLKGAYEAYQTYKELTTAVEEAEVMLKDEDPEIREMAALEKSEAEEKLAVLDDKIQELLLPKDPEDDNDCMVDRKSVV